MQSDNPTAHDADLEVLSAIRVGTGWIELTTLGEPRVVATARGYAPVLEVVVNKGGLRYKLYISAKSIAEALEPLRRKNSGRFAGLRFAIRKASTEQMAPYEIRELSE